MAISEFPYSIMSSREVPTNRDVASYKHRWRIERTNAWLHCYRGVAVRWSYYSFMYEGLVYISFIHMALQRF